MDEKAFLKAVFMAVQLRRLRPVMETSGRVQTELGLYYCNVK